MARKKSSKSSKAEASQSTTTTSQESSDIIPFEQGWQKIKGGGVLPFFERIDSLDEKRFQNKSIPQTEYSETYDTIFNMCIQREPFNFSEGLYKKLTDSYIEYNQTVVIPHIKEAKAKHSVSFLHEWVHRWRSNKWVTDGLRRMFMYLDRFYVPNSEDLKTTSEQGYSLFRQNVFDLFKVSARDAILDAIRKERENEVQDRDLLKEAIAVFVELGQKLTKVDLTLYKEDFEDAFITATREFYEVKSRAWLDQDSCPDYMEKAENCVLEEERRLSSYIHPSSKDLLMTAARDELLKAHQDELLNKKSGIASLLEKEAKEDLARMYRLYESVQDGLKPVAQAMKKHVENLGHSFISQSKQAQGADKEHKLVLNLISLHERFYHIVQRNFQNAQVFQKALKEAFEDFINKEYYTSNLLAKFINDLLRKGSKVAVDDFEKALDHVVMLYGYIRDKDIFERDYQQYLSHRLLQALSTSEQAEKRMIGKLKTECGYQWTSKLEGMFKDVQLSGELMSKWRTSLGKNAAFDLEVNVCTTGCWLMKAQQPMQLPPQLSRVCDQFKSFYLDKHNGRRLQWRMDQGKADVQINFSPNTRKIVNVTSYQMLILLLFNHPNPKTKLTFRQIADQTQIPQEDLTVHLLSLAHPKVKVLLKNPNSNKIEDNHTFMLNFKYKNNLYRVKIPLLTKLGKSDQQKQEIERTQNMRRRHQIDAAIVRIMKTRKTLNHMSLLTEVVDQLKARFQPSGTDIKKRIESLIDQDYLERDPSDRTIYNYKA